MDGISYEPLIRDMTWSYSRIKSYDDCPYRWYLKYIRYPGKGKRLFFSDYGKLMHELIAEVLSGELTTFEGKLEYLKRFPASVPARAPSPKIFQSYFNSGLSYFDHLCPSEHRVLAVEKEVTFRINGIPFIGYIDLLEKSPNNKTLVTDHKSRALKPRSGRSKPTKSDMELDEYLVQLYLYSTHVMEELGHSPERLCFNCFRTLTRIEEPFRPEKYDSAVKWAVDTIDRIAVDTEFRPSIEYFKCRYLCEMQDQCDYYRLSKR